MKKIILLFIVMTLLCSELIAQTLIKSDLNGTEWFSNNKNSHFYKADTITLIKIQKTDTPKHSVDNLVAFAVYRWCGAGWAKFHICTGRSAVVQL